LHKSSDVATLFSLGEAKSHGYRITARCAWGRRDGMKSRRECLYRYDLDLESLIWTRGAAYPISMLPERLKCPRCGSRRGGASVQLAVCAGTQARVTTVAALPLPTICC
jgi:hypothetical protein